MWKKIQKILKKYWLNSKKKIEVGKKSSESYNILVMNKKHIFSARQIFPEDM